MSRANTAPTPSLCAISLDYLLRLRLGALAGQALAYGWVSASLGLILPIPPLIALGLGLLGYTLWGIRRAGALPESGSCSLLREAVIYLASIACAVYLTGGAHNPLIILLLLPVMVAAATLQRRLIWAVCALATSAYSLLMEFHHDFPAPHHGTSGFDLHVQGMWYAFILSALLIAYFVAGPDVTLPIYIFSSIRRGVTPEINAVGSVVLFTSLALLIVAQLVSQRGQKPAR